MKRSIEEIAFVGSYVPRRCGIATFTHDLLSSMQREFRHTPTMVLPVTDLHHDYAYPSEAALEIREDNADSYERAGEFLDRSDTEMVSLQHEFGLFGGEAGAQVTGLLDHLSAPVVTTFHTIFEHPERAFRDVMALVVERSDRLVAMADRGKEFLVDVYHAPERKIDVIPHGIHDLSYSSSDVHKGTVGLEGRILLLTFGLLNPAKGIEFVLEALPRIASEFPSVIYVILGRTHPSEQWERGEWYRERLQELVAENGLAEHVRFENRYIGLGELKEYIQACDFYVTPYLNHEQITSGTLAYVLGAGKAILSTPYYYAEELLADGRGVLVPFSDPDALASELLRLMRNDSKRESIQRRAYTAGREMIWPRVAHSYMASFERAMPVV